MKIKTSELKDAALDWAVSKAIGDYKPVAVPAYSTDWAQGGPIIEREGIQLALVGDFCWEASRNADGVFCLGRTQLIAAMRCFVASKLGDEVDVPDELNQGVKK